MNIINKFTLRTLLNNKVRTLITIIGIILSVSMITAVTTFISSLQTYLIEITISDAGDWHGAVFQLDTSELEEIKEKGDIAEYGVGETVGYADLELSENEYKPYIYIYGLGEGLSDILPIKMLDGRMPTNHSELLLPKHLKTNGGVNYKIGDVLTLDIGDRIFQEETLYQLTSFIKGENGEEEKLEIRDRKSYTVVGFYERPSFEDFSAPGYTALTIAQKEEVNSYDVYMKVKSPKNIYSFLENNYLGKSSIYNNDYLRVINASNNSGYNKVLYSLGSILIIIIMFGSISLIYNAFSISVSERLKQFGLIASIGATKKQILKSVIYEAIVLSGIGIPLGIGSGILGIGITLELTKDLFLTLMSGEVKLHLTASTSSIIIAGLVGLITVLISAYIPARRAVKMPAIEAIKLTSDIHINGKKVKTSYLTYKLFGLEGMIASKNFKRNRRKYRATIISLFMSIVLFISASSFCVYLTKSVTTVVDNADYDIRYEFFPKDLENMEYTELISTLSSIDGVTNMNYATSTYMDMFVHKKDMNPSYLEYLESLPADNGIRTTVDETIGLYPMVHFIDDNAYEMYIKDRGYRFDSDSKVPIAIAMDKVKNYNSEKGKYQTFRVLKGNDIGSYLIIEKDLENLEKTSIKTDATGNIFYEYMNEEGKTYQYPMEEVTTELPIQIGAITEKGPFGFSSYYGNALSLIFPLSQRNAILNTNEFEEPIALYLKTSDHKEVYTKLYKALEELNLPTYSLYDVIEASQNERAMVTVITVFSYGFITLISLIAAANVFNTISTNIALRRREFAMLKSMGMTKKGFHKMMNYECLLYGIKGLLYGIPVSILVTYYIYRSILYGLEMEFFIPLDKIMIAIGSVFIVVFATMLYSMNKIKKENTIDALKNENT